MPPSKPRPQFPPLEDSRSETSTVRERQIAAAAHARKSKQTAAAASARETSTAQTLKDLASITSLQPSSSLTNGNGNTGIGSEQQSAAGMSWNTAPLELLNSYRLAHALPNCPAAFTSPLRQALLEDGRVGGIGGRSPTMCRGRGKRRVGREVLATSVRKHFNGAAVSETDVVVGLVYRVRNRDKAFRMRSAPGVTKK